jgi:hypothetical protein
MQLSFHSDLDLFCEQGHKGLHHMPHAMLRLLQTYVLPSVMNCCQSWGPDLLNRRDFLSNNLLKVMLSFYSQSWVSEQVHHHLAYLTRLVQYHYNLTGWVHA